MSPPNPPQQQNRQQRNPGQNRNPGRQNAGNPVTAPLTPKGLAQETHQITNLKFKPLLQKERAERRASNQRVGQVGNWWNDYLNTVTQGRNETAAAYGAANQQAQNLIGQTSALDSANTGRLQQEANQNAALRGAQPSTEAGNREAAAQGQRNYLAAATGGRIAGQGANTYAYLTGQKAIGVGQKIAAQKEEQRRGRTIGEDIKTTVGERGEYAGKTRGELKEKERNYQIQRAATGLNNRQQNQSEREGAQENRRKNEANRRANEGQRNENTTTKAGLKGGTAGLTPSERNTRREAREGAWHTARNLYRIATKKPSTPKEWAEFGQLVASESEISPADAHWAVSRLEQRVGNRPKPEPSFVAPGLP